MKDNFTFTTKGLIKKINDDSIGIRVSEDLTRVCVCDGHWGKEAALQAKKDCLLIKNFPTNSRAALSLINGIQMKLFKRFGRLKMKPEKDFTPETSLLTVELSKNNELRIISYGDCRLMVTRQGKIIFKIKTINTWLGAFSFLGLRNRITVKKATIFKKIVCQSGDLIWIFTDGVDECIYEKPTISLKWLAKTGLQDDDLKKIINIVMGEIRRLGAEDNASIAIIKC